MKKVKIKIPKEVMYLGDMKGFELPNGIFDKVITGCGATTVAIKDNYPTVLVAPRRALLSNKAKQHPETLWVTPGILNSEENVLENYLKSTKVPKLLITYDSFPRLLDIIDINDYRVVVDEFHRLLKDASFKSDVEFDLAESLKKCPYVTLLSATPISEALIKRSEYLSGVTYYEADWEELDVVKISSIRSDSPISVVYKIIDVYIANGGFKIISKSRESVMSTEAIFFINSVKHIVNCIKTKGLKPEQVNILVSKTDANINFIKKKLGSKYVIGDPPLKNEPNKPFTFCTSTAFDGVDFYSDSAMVFAVSLASVNSTLLDVVTDIQQIAGRQRLASNPFHNTLFFIYNESKMLSMSDEEIDKLTFTKKSISVEKCDLINKASEDLRKAECQLWENIDTFKYNNFYIYSGEDSLHFNEFLMLTEIDGLKIIRDYFKNGIKTRVINTEKTKLVQDIFMIADEVIKKYLKSPSVRNALRNTKDKEEFEQAVELLGGNLEFRDIEMMEEVGYERCKTLGFNKDRIMEEYLMGKNSNRKELRRRLLSQFEKSENFLQTQTIKTIVTNFYGEIGIRRSVPASVIYDIFTDKEVTASRKVVSGKRQRGYQLLI